MLFRSVVNAESQSTAVYTQSDFLDGLKIHVDPKGPTQLSRNSVTPRTEQTFNNYFLCISRTTRPATVPASRPSYTLKFKLALDPDRGKEDEDSLLEFGQGPRFKEDLDLATSCNINSLDCVLAIPRDQSE